MNDTLFQAAGRALLINDVDAKIAALHQIQDAWESGQLETPPTAEYTAPPDAGRPARPVLVPPRELPKRRLGSAEGHGAMIHAIAHIEFNAINLACDAVCRFPGLPPEYYSDWLRIALEEGVHFNLLRDRLRQLGFDYGDFPAHNGLWELAQQTAHDPLVRMALVPRVMEARGLDVTPDIMQKFETIEDHATLSALSIILRDEIGHVEAGSRWYRYLCEQRGLEPETTYFELLHTYLKGKVHCPLHKQARLQAGFTDSELQRLEALCAG